MELAELIPLLSSLISELENDNSGEVLVEISENLNDISELLFSIDLTVKYLFGCFIVLLGFYICYKFIKSIF